MRIRRTRAGVDELLQIAATVAELVNTSDLSRTPAGAGYNEVLAVAGELVYAREHNRSRRETAEMTRLCAELRASLERSLPWLVRHLAGRLWRSHVDLQEAARRLDSLATDHEPVCEKIALLKRTSDEMESRIARLVRELAKPIETVHEDPEELARVEPSP